MTYIGIDPGKSGAMALINEDFIHKVPFDERAYVETLKNLIGKSIAVVENVHAMPKQGVSSSFNFGKNFGWILGMLDSLGIPYELVNPQKWKKEFSCTSDKNTSLSVARRLFQGVSLRRSDRCTTDDDGIAEALLMAEYGRRHF